MTTLPLDVDNLLGVLDDPATEPFDGLAAGTVMGHVHLCVASIPDTVAFYRDVLGFGLMAQLGNQAAFLSAGGYHHHLGGEHLGERGRLSRAAGNGAPPCTRRSSCPTRPSAIALVARLDAAGPAGDRGRPRPGRASTRPGTGSSSRSPDRLATG